MEGEHNHDHYSHHYDPAVIALLANRTGDALAERSMVGGADILAAIKASELDMTTQFGNASRELLQGQTSGFRDLVTTTNTVRAEVGTGFSAIGVQAEKLSAAQALATNSVGSLVNLASKDIQIAGLKTQLETDAKLCALQAQIAECCCEIKQAVKADGDETRALINGNTVDALRAQLADAKDAARDAALTAALAGGPGNSVR